MLLLEPLKTSIVKSFSELFTVLNIEDKAAMRVLLISNSTYAELNNLIQVYQPSVRLYLNDYEVSIEEIATVKRTKWSGKDYLSYMSLICLAEWSFQEPKLEKEMFNLFTKSTKSLQKKLKKGNRATALKLLETPNTLTDLVNYCQMIYCLSFYVDNIFDLCGVCDIFSIEKEMTILSRDISISCVELVDTILYEKEYYNKLVEDTLHIPREFNALVDNMNNTDKRIREILTSNKVLTSRIGEMKGVLANLLKDDTEIGYSSQDGEGNISDLEMIERDSKARLELETIELELLEKKIEKLKEYKELFLESYEFFSHREINTIDEVDNADSLSDKRIVIFGGYDEWLRKMSTILQERGIKFKIVSSNLRGTLPTLTNTDIVLFSVAGVAHSYYYKLINHLKKSEAKFYRISDICTQETLEYIYGA